MSPTKTLATSARVLRQLSHDHRTLAMLFVLPLLLLGLLSWIYSATPQMFDLIGPALLGVFPLIVMFLVTSIATLRERRLGTLERLMAMPVGKLDIILGYAGSFGLLAILQAVLVSTVAVRLYGLDVAGPVWFLVIVAVANALLGTMLGLLASAFAASEFQAVQFMPAFVLPQFLLCGLLVPVAQLPSALELVANCLPLTYAVEAMTLVSRNPALTSEMVTDVAVVAAFAIAALLLGAATLRRRTK